MCPKAIGTDGLHILPTTILLSLQTTRTGSGSRQSFFSQELLGKLDGRRLHNNGRLASFSFVFSFLFHVGKFSLSSNSFLYPHKHAIHFISKIDSQYESKSERATLIATCLWLFFFVFFFFLTWGMAGERGIKLALLCVLMCGGIFGAGTRLWSASAIMKRAHYGEMGCLLWYIISLLLLLLLANSLGKMFKRPFGMNHYKRGGSRRNKNMDYLLHQTCTKAYIC